MGYSLRHRRLPKDSKPIDISVQRRPRGDAVDVKIPNRTHGNHPSGEEHPEWKVIL